MRRPPAAFLLACAALLLGLALPVRAAEPAVLEGPTTDLAGVLGDREAEVDDALNDLLETDGVQLFALFVPTTDGQSAQDYGQAVVDRNSLGVDDALVLVAVEDRTDWLWVSSSLDEVSDQELDALVADVLEPRLRDGDFAGAVIAVADRMAEAVSTDTGVTPGGSTGDGGGDVGGLLGVVLVVGGIGLVGWWFVQRRRAAASAEERDRRTGQLAREANNLLIATDERVRDAAQELGFVEAEYGAQEVEPLRAAIEAARSQLRDAFAVRQKLDDAEPETPVQREQMLGEIVTRARAAQAALDQEAQRIEALRDLERDAPAILAALPARIEAAEARLPTADAAMASLHRYAPSTSQPVRGNLEEARKGLAGARAAVEAGRTALAADNRRAAAQAARTGEAGVAGATALVDAVEKLSASARDAEAAIRDELAAAATDIADARVAVAGSPSSNRVEGAIATAEAALGEARAAASATPLDPLEGLRRATAAHRAADDLLAAARQDAEQRARFAAALDASIATARAHIDRADDYVASRRGGIGRTARTRLAEAQRQLSLATALREREPAEAMEAARTAERLADDAYREAGSDFDAWNRGGPGWGGRGGGDQVGAMLGGILTGILLGGRGGGWGGSPWGSPRGPVGTPGGWGGGGRGRGGNWGGGGWGGGGGGGRSRGGRW